MKIVNGELLPHSRLMSDEPASILGAVHDEAIVWMKIGICSKHIEALIKCHEMGADCSAHRAAALKCKSESDQVAWRQLQQNAIVQCPEANQTYVNCMVESRRSTLQATVVERDRCKPLWIAMQLCAAKHVISHIQVQSKRMDGGFTPPSMYTKSWKGAYVNLFQGLWEYENTSRQGNAFPRK